MKKKITPITHVMMYFLPTKYFSILMINKNFAALQKFELLGTFSNTKTLITQKRLRIWEFC